MKTSALHTMHVFHITALIAGALISRYMRTNDTIDTFSVKVNAALAGADSVTVEEVSIYDIQANRTMNKGYDRAVNTDDLAIVE